MERCVGCVVVAAAGDPQVRIVVVHVAIRCVSLCQYRTMEVSWRMYFDVDLIVEFFQDKGRAGARTNVSFCRIDAGTTMV